MKRFRHMGGIAWALSAVAALSLAACQDKEGEDEIVERFTVNNITATANSDATITIAGSVTTNKRLTTFELVSTTRQDASGKAVSYDLLEGSEAERNRTEDGREWTTTLSATNVPVDIYTLRVRTRLNTTRTATIGATYGPIRAGSGANTQYGSYLSLSTGTSYLLTDLTANPNLIPTVEVIINGDLSLKSAREAIAARNGTFSQSTADAKVYKNADNTCVITSTEVIASVTLTPHADDNTIIDVSGILIKTGEIIWVDVSGENF